MIAFQNTRTVITVDEYCDALDTHHNREMLAFGFRYSDNLYIGVTHNGIFEVVLPWHTEPFASLDEAEAKLYSFKQTEV